ncbi:hypothetical protein ACTMTJ_13610 [Phytohabitans sp. LJ34]|uniref:hypothetical protein n=1 Tax=Phytohabitans sp. LJ34 TaxID=3452217 RepID=UPI003F8C4BB3
MDYVYYASLSAGRTRANPAGVVRRRMTSGVPVDEAFTRNLRWERTWALYEAERLGGDGEFAPITEAEAEAFVQRAIAKLSPPPT